MATHLSPDVLIAVNSSLAGITLFGGMACLGIWLYDRTMRAYLWACLLAVAMTLTLLSGAAIGLGSQGWTQLAVFVRSTLYGCCAVLAVHAAGHLMPGLRVRWILRALVAVLLFRTILWWPTELIALREPNAAGWPQYGHMVWTTGLYNLGVVAAGALAYRRSAGNIRPVIVACGVALVALTMAPPSLTSGAALEEVLTLNVLPGGVAVLVLAGRTLLRTARGHDTLVRRQEVLLRLSQDAVTEPIDTVRRNVERELSTELRRDVKVAISGLNRFPQPGPEGPTIRVSGRRQRAVVRGLANLPKATNQFVEATLRVLLTASERALGDADHAHAAGHDPHTGLLTLATLTTRLQDRLQDEDRAAIVLVLCRLAGLGQVSAVDGQERVDEVIKKVTEALGGLRRSRTTLARVSTESFGIADQVAPDEADAFLAERLDEVRAAISAVVPTARLSLGAARADPGATAASLLSNAAVALERAAVGGDAVFDDAIGLHVRARVALERDLDDALERDEIEVRYQPVVTVGGRSVVAVEALARWRRGNEMMPPDMWIPVAERNGLIHGIDQRVLQLAARDQKRFGVPVAVNVSALELAEESFVADVLRSIGDCPPDQVILEMTESSVMGDLDRSVALLQELRGHGIRVALDDFGSSYSSLAALADLPVDILKLDSSFVARLQQANGVVVVQAVIALGRSLGKPIVAEGVETDAQLSLLASLGVDRVQGYLLGRPSTVDELAGTFGTAPSDGRPQRLFVVGSVSEVRG